VACLRELLCCGSLSSPFIQFDVVRA